MPPRRSSRAPSASLEAPPVSETGKVKRKRGQTVEPDTEGKENVVKPPSRTRRSSRSSVAPPSKARTVSRSKVSLSDVAESDNERQSDAPPLKKARPSIEAKDTEEPEGDAEASAGSEEKPKRGGRRKSAKDNHPTEPEEAASRRATTRTTKGAIKAVDEDEGDQEAEAPSENDGEEEKPSRKGRKLKAAAARKSTKKVVKPAIADDPDDGLEPPPPRQIKSETGKTNGIQHPSLKKEVPTTEEDEEEERSLFEPPPISALPTSVLPVPEQPQGPQARLVIHKIVLVNFKSYAGRQDIGPFHKSFSAIVGPNGSGKSNTIDALLFVFGYRASKMRQGKISELIHNSANYPDLDECSVEIHFREIIDLPGPDAFTVVPESQLSVTRTAYKNNSSKYTINGRASTYSEVQTLLKGRGIDLDHNRFLILQGEVESIAQMKPKAPTEHEDGLLEYLEDIIGTAKYKEPIDEAMIEVERLQEDRQIKLNRLRLVEKEKAALEERKKEAEDFLRLKNELVRARSREIQWYLWKFFEMENKFKTQIAKQKKELEKETEQHKDDIEHLELLRKHYEEREKAYEEVQAAAAAALKDLAQFERQEIGLQEKRKHTGGRVKKLKKSIVDDTSAHKTALNTIKDSTAKVDNEKQKVEDLESSLDREEKVLEGIQDSLKDKTQVFHDKIQDKQKELQPWTAQINTKQAEIDVATSERDALAKKAEALRDQMKEAEEKFSSLQSESKTKVEHQNELRTEKGQLQKRIQEADKLLKAAHANVQEWRGKASTSRNKIEEARASQSENKTRNNVLDSLTRLKEAGKVQGFHGRLGNLGTIPDKYDVAISTACGGALNNMVVDTVEQAQTCIEYLRKNNVGRASFMVLEKLKGAGIGAMQTPENVPRLLDLVKPKSEEYLPAFSRALGITLVAKDMDQANRIAFGGSRRWRVVTLDGGLIEVSGAMSGGGSQPSRGAMSSKFASATISPQVLQSYERDNEHATVQLQKVTGELREAEMEMERLTARDPEIDFALQKIGMDIENSRRRIVEAERRVKELNSQNRPNTGDLTRISNLERDITASQHGLNKLQEKTNRIEQDIKDLEKKILEIGGSKLLAQKSKVDGIRTLIGIANDEITKAEVAKNKAEKDSARLEGTLANNFVTLQELESEMQQLEERLEGLANEVAQLREKVEAAQSAADNSKEDLENLKTELDAKEDEISGFRQREMKLKQAIGDYENQLKEVDRGIEEYNQAHEELKLEEIEGDDNDEDEGDKQEGGEHAMGQDPMEAQIKPEPEEKEQSHKGKAKAPMNELPILGEDELRKFRKEELLADVVHLQEQIAKARPDLSVLKEYKQREQEFMNRAQDLENITTERDAQKAKYEGLRKLRLDEFLSGFNSISLKLKEMYQMITLGGNAELELVDSLDPFAEGIIFSVMPPKKSWKNISNLSGGEKTLSSLALVFALHVFKPTPLYFMDEIDAALDFRNVSIVANYIKDRTKNAQFIIISLRNDMFELSHRLIGIYKTSNQTRSISIDNHSLQSSIPAPQQQVQDDLNA